MRIFLQTKSMLKNMIQKLNKDSISVIVAVIAIVVVTVLAFAGSNPTLNKVLSSINLGNSNEIVAKNVVDYLNKNVLQNGQTATITSVGEESGLVKIGLKIGTNSYDSYATRDGKLLFPEALKLTTDNSAPVATNSTEPTTVKPADLKKVDNSKLDVFVVSRCPFGLQIQRAVAEALKTVPSLANYIDVKYIGQANGNSITSMHGDAEAKENLRQICIRQEQKDKYWPYVACQMKSADAADKCLASTGVDTAKLNACVADANRGVAYAKEDFALNEKFNIQGSPTLILNDQQISEFDFGGRSAEAMKKLICDSSTNAPSFCSTKLSEAQAATAFSTTYSTDSSTAPSTVATANSGATGANCAPAQ